MSIATAIQNAQGKVANAYTAVSNKGGALPQTQDLSNLPTAINGIPSGVTPTLITKNITQNGTYNASSDNADGYSSVTVNVSGGGYTLRRIKDDSNNEIGTAFMLFTDANGNQYDVVCLDAAYRLAQASVCSSRVQITTMPTYTSANPTNWWYDDALETATQNTQSILDFCNANSYSSSACSHCRSQSFTINNIVYYGQLPNMRQVFEMWKNRVSIEAMDTTASSYSTLNFSSLRQIRSSNRAMTTQFWQLHSVGSIAGYNLDNNSFIAPVIEIPHT